MAHREFQRTVSTDLDGSRGLCLGCGNAAEICLLTLEGVSQGTSCFCLACGEEYMRELLRQRAIHHRIAHAGADAAHAPISHNPVSHDDGDGGIIFWEGQGWSSDGPFAGA